MIVFVDDPNLIPYIVEQSQSNTVIYNMTSLYSNVTPYNIYPLVTNMYSINQSGLPTNIFVDTYEFDLTYAQAIFNDNIMFSTFMSVILPSYEGMTVIILVHRDMYRDSLMESLIKLIQQRYGYNAWVIESIDDIPCIKESTYTADGLMNLQQDIERYKMLIAAGQATFPPIVINNIETIGYRGE